MHLNLLWQIKDEMPVVVCMSRIFIIRAGSGLSPTQNLAHWPLVLSGPILLRPDFGLTQPKKLHFWLKN